MEMSNTTKKILKVIAICILIFVSACELYIISYYVDNFINGYTERDVLGNIVNETVYGWDAIKNDGWSHFISVPIFNIASIVQSVYFGLKLRENEKYMRIWRISSLVLLVINVMLWICIL